jgi:hypothetical protein
MSAPAVLRAVRVPFRLPTHAMRHSMRPLAAPPLIEPCGLFRHVGHVVACLRAGSGASRRSRHFGSVRVLGGGYRRSLRGKPRVRPVWCAAVVFGWPQAVSCALSVVLLPQNDARLFRYAAAAPAEVGAGGNALTVKRARLTSPFRTLTPFGGSVKGKMNDRKKRGVGAVSAQKRRAAVALDRPTECC